MVNIKLVTAEQQAQSKMGEEIKMGIQCEAERFHTASFI